MDSIYQQRNGRKLLLYEDGNRIWASSLPYRRGNWPQLLEEDCLYGLISGEYEGMIWYVYHDLHHRIILRRLGQQAKTILLSDEGDLHRYHPLFLTELSGELLLFYESELPEKKGYELSLMLPLKEKKNWTMKKDFRRELPLNFWKKGEVIYLFSQEPGQKEPWIGGVDAKGEIRLFELTEHTKLNELGEKITGIYAEKSLLEERTLQAENRLKLLEEEQLQMKALLKTREEEGKRLERSLRSAQEERSQLEKNFGSVQRERERLESSFKSAQEKREQLESSLKRIQEESQKEERSFRRIQEERSRLETSLQSVQEKNKELETVLTAREAALRQREAQLAQALKQYQELSELTKQVQEEGKKWRSLAESRRIK